MSAYFIKPKIVVANLDTNVFKEFPMGKKVLVLVSKSVRLLFNLNKLFDSLSASRDLYIYDHIRPDAPFEDLDKIISGMADQRPDSIIAIGGGSVIDAAKALSVSFSGVSYKEVFYGKKEVPGTKIKVLAVPTTAGTGAELSFGAILYDGENKVKGGVRGEIIQPDFVLIDAKLHHACPLKLKAEVGFDCLTHAVETYISRKSNALVKIQSVSCIKAIFDHLPAACMDQSLYDMEKVAIFSTLMGINLAYSSTCLPHRIQYVIGPLTRTSHAQGLIALYKGWIPHLVENNTAQFSELARDLGMDTFDLYNKISNLKKILNIEYSLADLGLQENQLEAIAGEVSGNLAADPSYRDRGSIVNILKQSI
jgi:alcohol dehydrogenase class IV